MKMIELIRTATNLRKPEFAPLRMEISHYQKVRAELFQKYATERNGIRMFRERGENLDRFNEKAVQLAGFPVAFTPRPIAWAMQQWL